MARYPTIAVLGWALSLLGCGEPSPKKSPETPAKTAPCGNGVLSEGEACDDGNRAPNDGCSPACGVELGWTCEGAPSRCTPRCGDGLVRGAEGCDEGAPPSMESGCSAACRPRLGFVCSGEGPGSCRPDCGDGRILPGEPCDDGNALSGDGCSATCGLEDGFHCELNAPTVCDPICGDARVVGTETCDDGNLDDGDGCSSSCVRRIAWRPIPSQDGPEPRHGAISVWTGRELFIWGGEDGSFFAEGYLYDPERRTWRGSTPSGAPSPRSSAAAVWTGTEVLIFGGYGAGLNSDGARYDPVADAWRPMSTLGAPSPRWGATAAWTGTEMIIFGGNGHDPQLSYQDQLLSDGGAYDPRTDRWRPLPSAGAPSPRLEHTSVWTGSELIIFGGLGPQNTALGDGARYDPASNTWRPLSAANAPSPRSAHNAIWTGTEMLVVGGVRGIWGTPVFDVFGWDAVLDDGAAYDPVHDRWRPIAPRPTGDGAFSAFGGWTGSEMIVWGGWPANRKGAQYTPSIDRWSDLQDEGAPTPRAEAAGAIVRNELVLFGGWALSKWSSRWPVPDGGRLDLSTGTWTPLFSSVELQPLGRPSATRFGSELIIVGNEFASDDRRGFRWDVVSGRRRLLSTTNAPAARTGATALATDRELFVWGGSVPQSGGALGDGGLYDLAEDRWTPIPEEAALSPRFHHAAAVTGTEVLIWGGKGASRALGDGARFDLETRQFRPMAPVGAPSPREQHTAVWTGAELIIWGGLEGGDALQTGARYDPVSDLWRPLSMEDAPEPRFAHTAIWTGTEMIVFGGWAPDMTAVGTGGRYDPRLDRWRPLPPLTAAPSFRAGHSAAWTGSQMVVFGGSIGDPAVPYYHEGARYDPALDVWFPLPTERGPEGRIDAAAVWMGVGLVVWGGWGNGNTPLADGAILDL